MKPLNTFKYVSLLAVLLATVFEARGQAANGYITNNSKQPVSDAMISIHNLTDSSLIGHTVSDEKGYYSIEGAQGIFLLKLQALGYKSAWIKCTSLQNNITLAGNNTLSEVSISARKPVIENKVDRTVFNVENSASAVGGDAYTALKKTPNVQVMQGQVSIAGKSGVAIMLNGRLQQLTGEDLIQLLHSIPVDNISKIEVITAPGAKYDAEGNSGIINIVTKKNVNEGFRGSVTAACTRNHYFSPSANTALQYKKGKFNAFVNAGTSTWNWVYTNRANMYYGAEHSFQKTDIEYSNKNSRIQVGADYLIGKKSLLGFVYTKGFGGADNKEHIRTDSYSTGELADSIMRTEGTTHEVFKGKHTVNLNYEWKIDSAGKKLNIDIDYFTQETERERNFELSTHPGEQIIVARPSQNRNYSGSAVNISSIKADLELPYSFAHFWLGGKASIVNNDGSFSYYTNTAQGYMADSSKANRFLYDENIQALYLNVQKNLKKLDIQGGVRMESTWNEGYTPATGQVNQRRYTTLFPSAKLLYKFNDKQSVALSYLKRINRPGYNFLNPFRFYYAEHSYTEGNPQLQPSFNHTIELSWFINHGHFIRIRTSRILNYWDRLYFVDDKTGVSSLTRVNIGKSVFYGFTYGFSHTVAKWWELHGNISAEYSRFRLQAYGQDNFYDGINGWIDVNNSFYLNKKKTLLADLHGYYYTPRQKDYKRWEEMSNFEGGIKALMMDKNLVIGLTFEDPFAKAYWFQTNKVNGTTEYSYDDGRIATLSVTFKFGNVNVKSRNKSDSNEEIQRAR